MRNSSKRALRWAAPVALVGATGLAACGDGSPAETARTASPSELAVGSDQHLVNQSEAVAWQERSSRAASDRLTGQAEAVAWQARSNRAATDRLTGQAEQYEGR
jgi:Tfp pilus assembly protein PilX